MNIPEFIARCRGIVGDRHVLDPADAQAYVVDWTGRWTGTPVCLVRPGSVDEVIEIVRLCRDQSVAIVPQGGNTGLVGGTAAPAASILMSLRSLDLLGDTDDVRGRLRVGAGVTLAAVHDHLRGGPWRYAVDFAARDSATIGGTVATNAGGVHVFRFGTTRAQVAGLEWVTSDGELIQRLSGLDKDNTGYDITSLLIGSEGTLGIVTHVDLRLVRRPATFVTALIGFGSIGAAVPAAWSIRAADPHSEVIEVIDGPCLDLVAATRRLSSPIGSCGAALLVESAGDDPSDGLAAAIDGCDDMRAVAVAATELDRQRLWEFRDGISGALPSLGDVSKFDLSLPFDELESFCAGAGSLASRGGQSARAWLFGHVCDGNLHLSVTGASDVGALEDAVMADVIARHGSISAEHGIGRAKARWLDRVRSSSDIAAMRSIKHALDPAHLLNPGAIFSEGEGPRSIDLDRPARP